MEKDKYIHQQLSAQIDREFDLLGHRVNWLLMGNAFLFTAMAIISNKNPNGVFPYQKILRYALPIIGLIICIISFVSIKSALKIVKEWKVNRKTIEDKLVKSLDITFGLTNPPTSDSHFNGNIPYWILPGCIGIVWILILSNLLGYFKL